MASWKCGASRDFAIVTRDSWDGSAAKAQIFEWAGFNGDSPDPSKAKKCFLAYDSDAPNLKGSYKLPFCNIVAGTPKAISAGITACAQRLPGTDIPADVKASAQSVIDAYKKKMDDSSGSNAVSVYGFPAHVLRATDQQQAMEMVKSSHAMDPTIFGEEGHAPFVWPMEISSNRLDTWFTRMAGSTLQNFANDAQSGVAFQDSHNSRRLSIGRVFSGTYQQDAETPRVLASAYTMRGLKMNDATYATTDDFINAMRAGIVNDVSVGFYGGQWVCSICGQDYWRGACPHIAGLDYPVNDTSGDTGDGDGAGEQMQVAFAWIRDAHLAEVSAVYDGATPGAMVLKAQEMIDAGHVKPRYARMLEQRYRVKLIGDPRSTVRLNNPKRGERDMAKCETCGIDGADLATKTARIKAQDSILDGLRAVFKENGIKESDDALEMARAAVARIKELTPLADDGRAYKNDLIEAALTEGVRAGGNDFKRETFKGILERSTLDEIKIMRDQWARDAKSKFPGGRQTKDGTEEEEGRQGLGRGLPAAAFQG
jgi:hypothetical protein